MQPNRIAKAFVQGLFALAIATVLAWTGRVAAADTGTLEPRGYQQQLVLRLEASSEPRDWALGSQLLATDPATAANLRERARILQKAAQAAPDDRLVQTLWANLPLAVARGRQRQPYPGHWLALARLEPDNGVAWLAVVDHAWKSGSPRAIDAALARMASAQSYNEHMGVAVAAWRDVFARFPPPAQARDSAFSAMADTADRVFDEVAASTTPPIESFVDACSKSKLRHVSAQRLRTCGTIGRLMMRRSQTMLGRLVGVALLRASHDGKPADVAMIRTVGWENEQYAKVVASMAKNPYAKQNHLDLLQQTDSEMQTILYELRIAGIALTPPVGWKQTLNGKPIEPLDDPSEMAP